MTVDTPHDENVTVLLQEIGKTLQENQRFLAALKQDQVDEGGLDVVLDVANDEEFEEL